MLNFLSKALFIKFFLVFSPNFFFLLLLGLLFHLFFLLFLLVLSLFFLFHQNFVLLIARVEFKDMVHQTFNCLDILHFFLLSQLFIFTIYLALIISLLFIVNVLVSPFKVLVTLKNSPLSVKVIDLVRVCIFDAKTRHFLVILIALRSCLLFLHLDRFE